MSTSEQDKCEDKSARIDEAKQLLSERREHALEQIDEDRSGIVIGKKWQSFANPEARKHYEGLDKRAGLALSGGGIRSATISLGLCEALATRGRLYGFDMLSTVSGGGYFGSFLRSLHFKRNGSAHEEAIADRRAFADATMASLPDQQYFRGKPGRSAFVQAGKIIKNPLWWLRENGRYLAPGGGADYASALAYVVRNWLTLMLLLTSVFVLVFGGLQAAMVIIERIVQQVDLPWFARQVQAVRLSPLVVLLVPGLSVLVGIGIAYWFSVGWPYFRLAPTRPGIARWLGRYTGVMIVVAAFVWLALAVMNGWVGDDPVATSLATFALIALGSALLSALIVAIINGLSADDANHVDYRRDLTRVLGMASLILAVIAALALIDSAALWLAPTISSGFAEVGEADMLATGTLSATIASVLSFLIAKLPDLVQGKQNWLATLFRQHAEKFALIASTLILFAIALLADTLAIKLLWNGPAWGAESTTDMTLFSGTMLIVTLVTLLLATSRNFTNLLALTPLYGSRLTRTFLGGSNARRLLAEHRNSVTRGQNDDDIAIQEYMESRNGAPLHLINVTRNRTIGELHGGAPIDEDHDDPLVLRSDRHPLGRLASYESALTLHDRQGDRMVFGPFGMRVGGRFVDWLDIKEPPTLGHLCAISGAAVGSGMGRLSSLGKSMAFTLANLRLGHWWPEQKSAQDAERERKPSFGAFFPRVLPGLACLLKELTGRFGTRNYWFLSDGGHSENTGVLTLLERGCQFIVAADNGQDPDFTFGDLEILVRSARTDIGMEVEVVDPAKFPKEFGPLRDHFLNGKDLNWRENARAKDHTGFALLLRALDIPEWNDGQWRSRSNSTSWIIWLKPNCFADLPADLAAYADQNPDFPQQTTANQFFDEAQWESYRRIGFEMGNRLLAERASFDAFLPLIHPKSPVGI